MNNNKKREADLPGRGIAPPATAAYLIRDRQDDVDVEIFLKMIVK